MGRASALAVLALLSIALLLAGAPEAALLAAWAAALAALALGPTPEQREARRRNPRPSRRWQAHPGDRP